MSPVNNEFKMASGKCAFLDLAACSNEDVEEVNTTRQSMTLVPVTGAIYHNGLEKPTERWSFELGLNLSEDKLLYTFLQRLEKGYEWHQGQMRRFEYCKFKLQVSAKDFTPKLPEWPKGRIFSIDSQEQWDNCFPKILGHERELIGRSGRQLITNELLCITSHSHHITTQFFLIKYLGEYIPPF